MCHVNRLSLPFLFDSLKIASSRLKKLCRSTTLFGQCYVFEVAHLAVCSIKICNIAKELNL